MKEGGGDHERAHSVTQGGHTVGFMTLGGRWRDWCGKCRVIERDRGYVVHKGIEVTFLLTKHLKFQNPSFDLLNIFNACYQTTLK